MVRFLAIVLSVMTLATAAWAGLAAYLSKFSPSASWVRGLYERKDAAVRRAAGPKLVLIGGSGTHYGFVASYLTELTGLRAVNFGTHAGLGPPYLLYRARRALRPGDIALLAIETPSTNVVLPTETTAEQVISDDLRYLLHASPETSLRILFGLGPRYALRMAGRIAFPRAPHPARSAESVTATGDESLEVSKYVGPGGSPLPEHPPPFRMAPALEAPRAFLEFFAWARANRVSLAQLWSPMLADKAYAHHPYPAQFKRVTDWYRAAGAIALGRVSDYYLDRSEIWDTIFHANERGRRRMTEILARNLCAAIACPTAPAAKR